MRWLWVILICLGVAHAAPPTGDVVAELKSAQIDDPPLEDPPDDATAQARTDRLTKALRCPVCQGLSVSDSPSDAARAMGDRIEELVRVGYTEDQITEYFVDRYGAWVELEPPSEGLHQILYLLPIIVIVIGSGWAVLAYRQTRARDAVQVQPAPDPVTSKDDGLDDYRQRILAELGQVEVGQ